MLASAIVYNYNDIVCIVHYFFLLLVLVHLVFVKKYDRAVKSNVSMGFIYQVVDYDPNNHPKEV